MKQTISTLSPVKCDSFSLTDKYGQSVEDVMDRFRAYPVIVEKTELGWSATPISHVHSRENDKPKEEAPVPTKPVVISAKESGHKPIPIKRNIKKRSK